MDILSRWAWLHRTVAEIYSWDMEYVEPEDYSREIAERLVQDFETHPDVDMPDWWNERWRGFMVENLWAIMQGDLAILNDSETD